MEETEDLDAWLGKPPEIPEERIKGPAFDAESDVHMSDHNLTDSNIGSPEGLQEIQSEENGGTPAARIQVISSEEEEVDEDDDETALASLNQTTSNCYVQVPPMPHDAEEYEYLPGHFKVKRVISELKGKRFLVKLQSGEVDLVSHSLLQALRSMLLAIAHLPLI
jgi:hypothetical protein